jgi:hypothetical protein
MNFIRSYHCLIIVFTTRAIDTGKGEGEEEKDSLICIYHTSSHVTKFSWRYHSLAP